MNQIIQGLVQEIVRFEITGKKMVSGTLIDVGSDTMCCSRHGFHVYSFQLYPELETDRDNEDNVQPPTELPSIVAEDTQDELSFEKVLEQAKGRLVEIFVSGNQSLHGTITAIMNNYFVFQSPIYKTMFIPTDHIKWLIPFDQGHKLYGAEYNFTSAQATSETFASSFAKQVEKFIKKFVVLNINERESFIGIINKVEEQIVEFQSAKTSPIYLNMRHIKTLHEV